MEKGLFMDYSRTNQEKGTQERMNGMDHTWSRWFGCTVTWTPGVFSQEKKDHSWGRIASPEVGEGRLKVFLLFSESRTDDLDKHLDQNRSLGTLNYMIYTNSYKTCSCSFGCFWKRFLHPLTSKRGSLKCSKMRYRDWDKDQRAILERITSGWLRKTNGVNVKIL